MSSVQAASCAQFLPGQWAVMALHDDCSGAAVAVLSLLVRASLLRLSNEAVAEYRLQVQAFYNDAP